MNRVDLVVIGCGPAGMSAAITAVNAGLSVVVLDEQKGPGGQIYRNISNSSDKRDDILGPSYAYGRSLVEAMQKTTVTHISEATVWNISVEDASADCMISFSVNNQANEIKAARLIVATGALERPMPIPGWTLPGVLTAGAGQILLKQSGLVVADSVIAGTGPLNLLLAQQMIRAGAPPVAIIETQTHQDLIRSMMQIAGALQGWRYLKQGAQMLAEIKRAGVKRFSGACDLKIKGEGRVETISFSHREKQQSLDCNTVLLHHGVIPNTQITRSLALEHIWDESQLCFKPLINKWQQTSLNQVYIAGDGAGIGGAKAAEMTGQIAALHVTASANKLTESERDNKVFIIRKALQRELAIRPFLDTAYKSAEAILNPNDETIICRCEEITAGEIRRYTKLGCKGPNQTKAFGRCGMGPCQGRYCGLAVTEILSRQNNMHPNEVGYYRIRSPLKPITVGELASLENSTG